MNRATLAERFADAPVPLKTWVIEAHHGGDADRFLAALADGAIISRTDDAYLHRMVEGEVEFVIDHLDDRYWSFHTWSGAADAQRLLKSRVQRRRDLDWAWLPAAHLSRLWAEGEPTWLRTEFHGEQSLPADDPARRMQLRLRGSQPDHLLAVLQGSPYASALAYDQVGVFAKDPNFGSVNEAVNSMGKFVATGDSFKLHEELVRLTLDRYRRLVDAVEARALSWSGDEAMGLRLHGEVIALSFSRAVPDLGRFLDTVFSSREPFRLWGVPRLQGDLATVEAVDLHVGQRLRLEVGTRWLRIFLGPGTCGNTVARLVTNLQHRFDAGISFDDPELQQHLAPAGPTLHAPSATTTA